LNTTITEQTDLGEMPVDVYTKLSNDRILFLTDFLDDRLATDITATLLLKDSEDPNQKITLFINSPGGDIRCVFMVYDMMNLVQAPIETVCIGSAFDEVALILAAGAPGMRFATKNATISISQLEAQGTRYSDLKTAKSMLDLKVQDNKRFLEALSKATGKPVKTLSSDFDRRVFMNCNQAVKYGLIDKVVSMGK
jgi:ATP-dependent Clp protease protease subunit